MKQPLKPKLILATIIAILLIIVITIINYLHSSTLIIQVAPVNANITINGKTYKNGLHKTAPKNKAEVTVSAEGFTSKTLTLDLKSGYSSSLLLYLVPLEEKWEIYEEEKNKESLNILLANNGYQYWNLNKISNNLTIDQDNSAENFIKKISIRSIMPLQFSICGEPANRLNCDSLTIDYNYSQKYNDSLCISISGRKANLEQSTLDIIRNKLTEYGYNLNDYNFFYQQNDN